MKEDISLLSIDDNLKSLNPITEDNVKNIEVKILKLFRNYQ